MKQLIEVILNMNRSATFMISVIFSNIKKRIVCKDMNKNKYISKLYQSFKLIFYLKNMKVRL